MRIKTKQKIINQTISLFNQQGFANVTTQNIAERVGISLGNLTYHFPKKDDLVAAIYNQLVMELRMVFATYRNFPDFSSIDSQLRAFYRFQEKYRFFYLDTLEIERAYANIAEKHQEHIAFQIQDVHNIFIFNVGKKNLRGDVEPGTYEMVAHMVWMTVAVWSYQLMIRGKSDEDNEDGMLNASWNLIKPYFTEQGKIAYQQLIKKKNSII